MYASLFAKGRSLLEKNPKNIVNGPSSSTDTCIRRVVFKTENRNVCYHVTISPLDGKSSCSCETFLTGKLKLCKHIASVAVREEIVDLVMSALAAKAADMRTSLMGNPHGGKKPGYFSKQKSAGHTRRENLTVLPTIEELSVYRESQSSFVRTAKPKGTIVFVYRKLARSFTICFTRCFTSCDWRVYC